MTTNIVATTGLYTANIDGHNTFSSPSLTDVLGKLVKTLREDLRGYNRNYIDDLIVQLEDDHSVEVTTTGYSAEFDEHYVETTTYGVGFIFTKGSE